MLRENGAMQVEQGEPFHDMPALNSTASSDPATDPLSSHLHSPTPAPGDAWLMGMAQYTQSLSYNQETISCKLIPPTITPRFERLRQATGAAKKWQVAKSRILRKTPGVPSGSAAPSSPRSFPSQAKEPDALNLAASIVTGWKQLSHTLPLEKPCKAPAGEEPARAAPMVPLPHAPALKTLGKLLEGAGGAGAAPMVQLPHAPALKTLGKLPKGAGSAGAAPMVQLPHAPALKTLGKPPEGAGGAGAAPMVQLPHAPALKTLGKLFEGAGGAGAAPMVQLPHAPALKTLGRPPEGAGGAGGVRLAFRSPVMQRNLSALPHASKVPPLKLEVGTPQQGPRALPLSSTDTQLMRMQHGSSPVHSAGQGPGPVLEARAEADVGQGLHAMHELVDEPSSPSSPGPEVALLGRSKSLRRAPSSKSRRQSLEQSKEVIAVIGMQSRKRWVAWRDWCKARLSWYRKPKLDGKRLTMELKLNMIRIQMCIPFSDLKTLLEEGRGKKEVPVDASKAEAPPLSKLRRGSLLQGGDTEIVARAAERSLRVDSELLCLERMLGTAMVHAYLSNTNLVDHKQLAAQGVLLERLPWEMPTKRSFGWYVSVFMVVLRKVSGKDWLRRSKLLRLVFLQSVDGSFAMTQGLINILQIGEPEEALSEKPVPFFSLQAFRGSIPEMLSTAVQEEAWWMSAESIWATLCAVESYNLMYTVDWIENPFSVLGEQKTMAETAADWVDKLFSRSATLQKMLPHLQATAKQLVEESEARRVERIQKLHDAIVAKQAPPTMLQRLRAAPQRTMAAMKEVSILFILSHPLFGVWMTPSIAPLSRAERIILLVNNHIVMLAIAVWFYFSKSLTCCKQLKEFAGCPDASDRYGSCLGYATCGVLVDMEATGAQMPRELQVWEYSCDAFPQSTLTGRLYAVLVIVVMLMPINAVLQSLFVISSSREMPAHWQIPKSGKKANRLYGAMGTIVVHAVINFMFALLVDFRKLNKTLALILVGFLSLVLKPAAVILAAFAFVVALWKRLYKVLVPSKDRSKLAPSPTDFSSVETAATLVSMYLVPVVNGLLEKMAYVIVLLFWMVMTWVLVTFSTVIRETMGDSAEQTLLEAWGMSLLMENFGKAGVRQVGFKLGAAWIVTKVNGIFEDKLDLQTWFEMHVMRKLRDSGRSMGEDEEEEEEGEGMDDDGGDGGEIDNGEIEMNM
ncbi:hypothetical protein CYMTET_56131 [Cymbomonas tetramitiformis]|uniref:Uncharacterized protein n=1 Tax=Cymbomonas tetramitiformis TaxID=36881 RepID=A0AAE0BD12_9CHLO|nr:hypothetical protein CYMTET_56131 [Cymbomonas tetramitiformis]